MTMTNKAEATKTLKTLLVGKTYDATLSGNILTILPKNGLGLSRPPVAVRVAGDLDSFTGRVFVSADSTISHVRD